VEYSQEIEAEADRCRSRGQRAEDGRIDVFGLLSNWNIRLIVKSDADMGKEEAYSVADRIHCRRAVSRGLRFGDPQARYVIGHELGHIFLHRGAAPKARKVDGNKKLGFISEEESAEVQAWKFSRALFITRLDLMSGEDDEDLALRVGIPSYAVGRRREEVRETLGARQPKAVPPSVVAYLEGARTVPVIKMAPGRLQS
jgi:hypothetical protein